MGESEKSVKCDVIARFGAAPGLSMHVYIDARREVEVRQRNYTS